MATGWKRGAEIVLAKSGVPRAISRRNQPSTAVLAYHNIVPVGEALAGDASLHLDQRAFADHLDFLLESHDIVSLSDAREATASSGRPRVVITFDDAYRGAMTAGLEELRRRDLPATVFVSPGLLGRPGFWWDLLAPKGGGPLAAELRDHCLTELRGREDWVLRWSAERGLAIHELPQHARPADAEAMLAEAQSGRVSLGSHTWSHPNLAALSAPNVEDELERSKAWLEARSAEYVDWLAYPYGLRNATATHAAEERYTGALLTRGGLAERRGRWLSSPHETPRLNVPRGLNIEGLAVRVAGLLA